MVHHPRLPLRPRRLAVHPGNRWAAGGETEGNVSGTLFPSRPGEGLAKAGTHNPGILDSHEKPIRPFRITTATVVMGPGLRAGTTVSMFGRLCRGRTESAPAPAPR